MSVGSKRIIFFLSALSLFILAVLYLEEGEQSQLGEKAELNENAELEEKKRLPVQLSAQEFEIDPADLTPQLPVVSIVDASLTQARLEIPVYGELKPKWAVAIKAQASGEVLDIPALVEVGARVSHGDTLLKLDATRYQARAHQAELALEQAKLDLTLARQKTALARQDWERSGLTDAPGDLMLFKPQLAIAEKNLKSAQSQLAVALKDLTATQVKAAFSGVVTERKVGLGQYVVEGEPLFELVDDQFLVLQVAIGELQWNQLNDEWKGQKVSLYSSHKKRLGQAILSRGGNVLDAETRQFKISLDVPPSLRKSARAGQYVHANLPGKTLSNILNLPESALTQDASIWLIDQEGYLQEYRPEYYHAQNERVLVAPPPQHFSTNGMWRVATQPLSYFMTGKQVEIKQAGVNEPLADSVY